MLKFKPKKSKNFQIDPRTVFRVFEPLLQSVHTGGGPLGVSPWNGLPGGVEKVRSIDARFRANREILSALRSISALSVKLKFNLLIITLIIIKSYLYYYLWSKQAPTSRCPWMTSRASSRTARTSTRRCSAMDTTCRSIRRRWSLRSTCGMFLREKHITQSTMRSRCCHVRDLPLLMFCWRSFTGYAETRTLFLLALMNRISLISVGWWISSQR